MIWPSITDESIFMSFLRRLAYVFWYFRRPPWDSGITPPELLEFLKTCPPGRAIDLGCGTGTNVINLARQGWRVTGVDFVPGAIEQAKKKALLAGVSVDFRVGDVTRLDGIQGPFDFALDLGCYHSLSGTERAAYLNQLERLLAPGGAWFLYAFLRTAGQDLITALSPQDLEQIQAHFRLSSRMDGFDRGKHPSAYFIFVKLNIGA
jgi:2-polyprenyl-3-methyl-5-hydroxy-6-metoxy-1,4-benzoquinol methylase